MIIGFPHQDRAGILSDFELLMSLEPSFTQILIYFAFPGTPFYAQAIAEDRYLPQYREHPDYRRWDGFSMHFKHPHLTAPEVEALQRDLYRRDFERLGPSLIRVPRIWFNGYMNLRNSPNPLLRARAERMRSFCRGAIAGLFPALLFGPSKEARRRARELLRDIERETGALTLGEKTERRRGGPAVRLDVVYAENEPLSAAQASAPRISPGEVRRRCSRRPRRGFIPISQPVTVLNEE